MPAFAVRATRLGALDFLEKPLSTDRLLLVLENALRLRRAEREAAELREEAGYFDELLGESAAMRTLRERVPEVTGVADATDHGSGRNPYFRRQAKA